MNHKGWKHAAAVLLAVSWIAGFGAGCGGVVWVTERKPETDAERKAVSDHEAQLLSKIPATLSGHDQDWDDAIATAHRVAVDTHCKTRLYERERTFDGYAGRYTGRMREDAQ